MTKKWTTIVFWGVCISIAPLLLGFGAGRSMIADEASLIGNIVYFLPYITTFGIACILGIFFDADRNDEKRPEFGWPFLSLLLAVALFDSVLAFWSARPDHFVLGRTYGADVVSNMLVLVPMALIQIAAPFVFGYFVGRLLGRR